MDSHGELLPTRGVGQSRRRHPRSRIPLSCDPCRTRKLKCNREKPCQNCTARDEQASCRFRTSKNAAGPNASRGDSGDEMRQRIDHLENLVRELIAQRRGTSSPREIEDKTTAPLNSGAGPVPAGVDGAARTLSDGVRSMYVSGDELQVVLQEINQLKRTWGQGQDSDGGRSLPPTLSPTVDGSSLLFNQVKPIEQMEVLSTLPPEPEVSKLLRRFFDRNTFPISVPPILHEPTFMQEYNEHSKDPSRTNLIWLGLLFSVLGITMLAFYQHGEPPEYQGLSESLFQLYRIRTAQCLLSGDISKCLPYTIEALRFNATAELNRKDDNRRGLWIMTGVLVRAAVNMGYHLDPSNSPGISMLQAEYRRRTWLSVISMDDMASFLGGFPRVTSAIPSDTEEPRNLHDWELSEAFTIAPPSRPLSEPTSVTYLIVKGRLFHALGRVAEINNAPGPVSYEAILQVDTAVQNAYRSIPIHMRVEPAIGSNNSLLSKSQSSNLGLHCMYHKGLCMLHRRFLAKERSNGKFKFSRDRCISSAKALLDVQSGLQPSFYKTSQTRQMLTLAAMIIFMELELRQRGPEKETSPDSDSLLQSLKQSCSRWAEAVGVCDDVRRAHEFLEGMLTSFYAGGGTGAGSSQTKSPEASLGFPSPGTRFDTYTGGTLIEDSLSNLGVDWAMWDGLIAGASQDYSGPMY